MLNHLRVPLTLAALSVAIFSAAAAERAIGPGGEIELIPLNDPASWVTADDYPTEALRMRQEGKVGMILDIGKDGVPRSCRIEQSSGSPVLDEQSCSLLMQRGRYKPPLDPAGKPTEVSHRRNINWVIPRGVDGRTVPVTIETIANGHRCSAEIGGQRRRLTAQLCEALVVSVQKAGRSVDEPIMAEFPDTPAFLEPAGG